MIQFVIENTWSVVAISSVVVLFVLSYIYSSEKKEIENKKEIKKELNKAWLLPLGCSLLNSNDSGSWNLRG